MPEVTSRGTRLYYEDTGAGPVMLLSHSWFCDGRQWPQVPALVDAGYRVLNLDNRGHGRAGPHREPFSIWDMADDLIAVLDDAGVDEAIVVGLSIGGFAGIRATLRYPDRVRALVLADTSAAAQSVVGRAKFTLLGPFARTPAKRLVVWQVVHALFGPTARRDQPELIRTWRDRFLAQDTESMLTVGHAIVGRDDVTDRLAEISVPTLVIVATRMPIPVWLLRSRWPRASQEPSSSPCPTPDTSPPSSSPTPSAPPCSASPPPCPHPPAERSFDPDQVAAAGEGRRDVVEPVWTRIEAMPGGPKRGRPGTRRGRGCSGSRGRRPRAACRPQLSVSPREGAAREVGDQVGLVEQFLG